MTKVVPVKMDEALYAHLQEVADKAGESESTIIRITLRAGLRQIEKDKYELMRLEPKVFRETVEKHFAPADGPSISSTLASGEIPSGLNEDPPAPAARITKTRAALRKMQERESGKDS